MSKIDKETATLEFDRFKKAMRLRLDRTGMDENDRRDVNEDIEILIDEIMEGRLTINDEGQAVYHPETGEPLTFKKPRGGNIAVIDKKKESQKIGQQYALIASFCDSAPSLIAAMEWDDITILLIITSLFFVR